jgi:hypothetical protein
VYKLDVDVLIACRGVGRGPGNYLLRVVRGRHSCSKVQGPYA